MGDRAELALRLTQGLRAAFLALQRAGDKACRAYGLSHRAHAALQAVDQGGPDGARPSEIASQLGVSRAAATTFIQRLESKALVETTPDPDDDRGVRVALTRHGLDVLSRCRAEAGKPPMVRPARAPPRRPDHRGLARLGPAARRAPARGVPPPPRRADDRDRPLTFHKAFDFSTRPE